MVHNHLEATFVTSLLYQIQVSSKLMFTAIQI